MVFMIVESLLKVLAQKNRRFMVYCHSKAIIVEDEYLICGSANINQPSWEGTRDTEIAIDAYQLYYSWQEITLLHVGRYPFLSTGIECYSGLSISVVLKIVLINPIVTSSAAYCFQLISLNDRTCLIHSKTI